MRHILKDSCITNKFPAKPDTIPDGINCRIREARRQESDPPDAGIRRRKGQVYGMEDGRKKIWICLLTVVIAAILIGVIYYYSAPQEQGTEGFLIREQGEESYVI